MDCTRPRFKDCKVSWLTSCWSGSLYHTPCFGVSYVSSWRLGEHLFPWVGGEQRRTRVYVVEEFLQHLAAEKLSVNSRVDKIDDLLYFSKRFLTKLIYQRGTEDLPIILPEIQDLVTERRGISYVECCLWSKSMTLGKLLHLNDEALTHLDQRGDKRIKIPEHKLFQQLTSLQRVCHRHSSMMTPR